MLDRKTLNENLISLPNILASLMCMFGLAFHANVLFSFGFLPFIWRNHKKGDKVQKTYFIILEVMAVIGVILHLMGWSIEEIFKL